MGDECPTRQASFRDPGGSLIAHQGRILRIVSAAGTADLEAYRTSAAVRQLVANGQAVTVREIGVDERTGLLAVEEFRETYAAAGGERVVEHERIPFPSYPYEWPAEMLLDAGRLTIRLARSLVDEGLGLKDATPFNILFRGTAPVFVDALSVERRDAGDSRWMAYAQFVRTFVLPLLAARDFGLAPPQIFVTRRDGLEPEEVYRLLGPLRRFRRPYFGLVTMPRLLGGRRGASYGTLYRKELDGDPERARYVLASTLAGLERALERAAPRTGASSAWSDYMAGNNNYSREQFLFKEKFARDALGEARPARVLDVGCNTGHFSALAARSGASVVAVDYDPVVIGAVWRAARAESLDILPLVVDLTRPSPATGWNNREKPSFLERGRGHFDGVLMLAVLHHMLVAERIRLADVLTTAAELTRSAVIIEFIGPGDSMFRRLVRGREELHRDLSEEVFEAACRARFEIERKARIPGAERSLYLLRKRR